MPSEGTYHGSFTLTGTDSGIDWDSDSKVNDIVLCRTFHIAPIRNQIPIPHFCTGQEAESEFIPESVSGNINVPLKESLNTTRFMWLQIIH